VVILLDLSEDMAVYRQDAVELVLQFVRWRGSVAVDVWGWPAGAGRAPKLLDERGAGHPWTRHTALLLVSQLGLGDPHAEQVWNGRLAELDQRGLSVSLLFPGVVSEAPAAGAWCREVVGWTEPGTRLATAGECQRVLQALSVFPAVDPGVLRACRRTFAPVASAALDAQVWRHDGWSRRGKRSVWRAAARDALADALHDAALWPEADLIRLAELVRRSHEAALAPSAFGLTLLTALAPLEARAAELPDALFDSRQAALQQQARLLAHATAMQPVGDRVGSDRESSEGSVATGFAWYTLDCLPASARRSWGELSGGWSAVAVAPAMRAGLPVALPSGVGQIVLPRPSPPHDATAPPSRQVILVQQGVELALQLRPPPFGVELGRFELQGEWLCLDSDGARTLLRFPDGPDARVLLPCRLPTPEQPLSVGSLLGTQGLTVSAWQRPRGSAGWGRDPAGLRLYLPTPWGTPLQVDFNDGVQSLWGQASARSGWQVGCDAIGVFADWTISEAVSQRFRYIEPGRFWMGSPPNETGRDDREGPRHRVTLTLGYWLADTPCTQGLWEAVVGDNPSHFKEGSDARERPVESVSWDRVQEFLKVLNGRLPTGCEAVLPTEAQWEYAARAGSESAYWWGDKPEAGLAN
jgi:hypothetical protein